MGKLHHAVRKVILRKVESEEVLAASWNGGLSYWAQDLMLPHPIRTHLKHSGAQIETQHCDGVVHQGSGSDVLSLEQVFPCIEYITGVCPAILE